MNPLIIYVFSGSYLKICGSEFNLNDLEDNFRHVSNYTVQKKNGKVEDKKNELTISNEDFIQKMKE